MTKGFLHTLVSVSKEMDFIALTLKGCNTRMKIRLIIFLVLTVSHRVRSQSRLVVNTTCLELAKPSNQQYRLTCREHDYHCLLDETFTKEFEVCREWKWIPGGKCAYFNTYGNGNVDERKCEPGINLTCSEIKEFESRQNPKFPACYAKKPRSTSLSTTKSPTQVKSKMTSDGYKVWIIFILYVIVIAVIFSISVIFYIQRYMGKRLCIKANHVNHVESQELIMSDLARTGDTVEGQSLLRIETEDTAERSPTMRREVENITESRMPDKSYNEGDTQELTDVFDDAIESLQRIAYPTDKSDNEGDTQELTDVFDDTIESLQRIAYPTDEQNEELCSELYNLLDTEGLKLTREVMAAAIIRETGKPVKIVLNNLTDQEKRKLMAILPEEPHRILGSKTEHDTSIHVSYGLHRIILDEEKSPKSGWGNPVREKDIGIGDDVERLNRIQTIVQGICNSVTVSVESYIRLLNIMREALTRLDPGAEFKEEYKLLSYKLEMYKK